ncbi:hypothetical protein CPB84DRAFT_1920741, partial [Gymnopilus junonius]
LVVHEIAEPLPSFQNTKELLCVFRDALRAHRIAHDDAGVLHGDISSANIMIVKEGCGLLIDRDLSNLTPSTVIRRTFLAARLLRSEGPLPPIPDRIDDQESFWHVLLWTVIQSCEHEYPEALIIRKLQSMFDRHFINSNGENTKSAELQSTDTVKRIKVTCKP